MISTGQPLDILDLPVQSFAGGIGAEVLPGVLNIGTPVSYAVDHITQFGNVRVFVAVNPIREECWSDINRTGPDLKSMEFLDGVIDLFQIGRECKTTLKAIFPVFR